MKLRKSSRVIVFLATFSLLTYAFTFSVLLKLFGSQPSCCTCQSGESRKVRDSTSKPVASQNSIRPGQPVKVVLFAYWRTGSSFTGEIFNQHNQAFYMYEPLNGFLFPMNYTSHTSQRLKSGEIVQVHDHVFKYDEVKQSDDNVSWFMKDLLDCNLERISDSVYAYRFMKKTQAFYEFNFCMDTDLSNVHKCRHFLIPICRSAKIRALKDVWINMPAVDLLLQRDPSVKIIHLVRDPRAQVYSFKKSFWNGNGDQNKLLNKAEDICRLMVEDLTLRQDMEKRYPRNIMQVLYEDLAENPMRVVQDIYHFIGDSLPSEVEEWVMESTSNQWSPRESPFQTARKNSTATAYKWKNDADFDTIKQIDSIAHCKTLYNLLGYLPVKSNVDLKNSASVHRLR